MQSVNEFVKLVNSPIVVSCPSLWTFNKSDWWIHIFNICWFVEHYKIILINREIPALTEFYKDYWYIFVKVGTVHF